MKIHKFTYGPFSENTYVLEDENSKEAIVIDPGMSNRSERESFKAQLISEKIKPSMLLNTHCHIDHVLGNKFIFDEYGLTPQIHKLASQTLSMAKLAADLYGIDYDESPEGEQSLFHDQEIVFHEHTLKVLFTPGHSPGHVVFLNENLKYVIGGDVLFQGSVGRVDLPGSNASDLVKSIQSVMYNLENEVTVHPGHGPETTIGYEKVNNHFVRENESSLS